MKRVAKRLTVLVMAVVMTASIFAGCGQKEDPPTQEATKAQETTKAQEPVTINYATWVNNKDASGSYLNEVVTKEFTKKNPNIQVKFQLLSENNSTEYLQKLDLMIAGGEEIDVVEYPSRASYYDRVARNVLAPLDEYIAAEGKKYSDLFNIDTAVNGKIYALPWDVKPMFVMLNKKYLDEAGLSIPKPDWTWNDFRDYAKKLSKGEGKDRRYGSYFWTVPGMKLYGVFNAYGYDPLLNKETGASNVTDPNIKEWLQFYSDMEKVDKSLYPYFEAKSGKISYRDIFFQGKIAMLPIGIWMIPEIAGTIDKYPHDWVTAFAPVPKFKDYPAGNSGGDAGFIGVPAGSKYKAEAYKFAKFNCEEGVSIRATGLPAKKEYNVDELLKTMMGGKENLYDVASLTTFLTTVKVTPNLKVFPYSQKVTDATDAQFEKFLVGGVALDKAIEDADKATKEIIAAATK